MRLASFFFISLALHAVALFYPVSFPHAKQEQLIQVMILPIEQQTPSTGGQDGSSGPRAPRVATKSSSSAAQTAQHLVQSNPMSSLKPRSEFAEALPNSTESNSAALVYMPSKSAETNGAAKISSAGDAGVGADNGGFGSGASGLGSSGNGAELGNGYGSSGNGAVLIQARYSETPKPIYPESARNEGCEGRVLLRVLVDDQGRSKRVEINNSSGNEALDRAAAEAIKRWRFVPARYDEKAVESWIRIPIDFSLADGKSW